MIHGLTCRQFVLEILSDYRPHFSREFVQASNGDPLLLDYRKRISELRQGGHKIEPLFLKDQFGNKRPGYQLYRPVNDQDLFSL